MKYYSKFATETSKGSFMILATIVHKKRTPQWRPSNFVNSDSIYSPPLANPTALRILYTVLRSTPARCATRVMLPLSSVINCEK